MMMTGDEAKIRNAKIFQLGEMLPRLLEYGNNNLITLEFAEGIEFDDLKTFNLVVKKMIDNLNKIKIKKFACTECLPSGVKIKTRNKKAYSCDYCGKWKNEDNPMFLVQYPKPKKRS